VKRRIRDRIGMRMSIPRPGSPVIQACELEGSPVVEYTPASRVIPTPINDVAELETMYRQCLVNR